MIVLRVVVQQGLGQLMSQMKKTMFSDPKIFHPSSFCASSHFYVSWKIRTFW